jgi:hypothetical protein
VSEHHGVPKEKAAVETFGALKEQYGDWHLAVGHHWQLKKWTQDSGGSQKKLAITHRQMTPPPRHSCTASGPRQGQCCKRNLERADVQEEALGTSGMQQRHMELGRKWAIMSGKQQDFQGDPRIGNCKENNRIFHQDSKKSVRTLWRGPPSQKRKKRLRRV